MQHSTRGCAEVAFVSPAGVLPGPVFESQVQHIFREALHSGRLEVTGGRVSHPARLVSNHLPGA